jgi:hypothetical protein
MEYDLYAYFSSPAVQVLSAVKRRMLFRLSGRNRRAVWSCKENVARAVASLQTAIWNDLHPPYARKSLWAKGQF